MISKIANYRQPITVDGVKDSLEILNRVGCSDLALNENFDKNVLVDYDDIDADGLGVAWDRDSDNDGYCDNQETGYIGNSATDQCGMFKADVFPKDKPPQCLNLSVALLAKEWMSLNDGFSCQTLDGSHHCRVATYGSIADGAYGVNLGAKAMIGDVYSASDVWMRSNSHVYGNVETAKTVTKQAGATIDGALVENSIRATGFEQAYAPFLENVFIQNLDFTPQYSFVGESNQEYYMPILWGIDGAHKEYIFNSNSVLTVSGHLQGLASSLKFQSGAVLNVESGAGAEFYIGNVFQWNGTIKAENMINAAKNIIVYYYGSETAYIQTNFAGTIIAPNAKVVVGQSGKHFYGAIYAKNIVVHQNTKFVWVPYEKSEQKINLAMLLNYYSVHFEI
ncbi:MAG: hypothetical protein HUK20_06745 [Fibrobacter sp.]|nr:hypothetical protein [Fibrobacter sp.]